MNTEIREWIAKAEEDWLAVVWLSHEDSPVWRPALFHLQQTTEKLLKAYLCKLRIVFQKKHDLTYLLQETKCEPLLVFQDLMDELAPFAVETRYPGFTPSLGRIDLLRLISKTDEFRTTILAVLANDG